MHQGSDQRVSATCPRGTGTPGRWLTLDARSMGRARGKAQGVRQGFLPRRGSHRRLLLLSPQTFFPQQRNVGQRRTPPGLFVQGPGRRSGTFCLHAPQGMSVRVRVPREGPKVLGRRGGRPEEVEVFGLGGPTRQANRQGIFPDLVEGEPAHHVVVTVAATARGVATLVMRRQGQRRRPGDAFQQPTRAAGMCPDALGFQRQGDRPTPTGRPDTARGAPHDFVQHQRVRMEEDGHVGILPGEAGGAVAVRSKIGRGGQQVGGVDGWRRRFVGPGLDDELIAAVRRSLSHHHVEANLGRLAWLGNQETRPRRGRRRFHDKVERQGGHTVVIVVVANAQSALSCLRWGINSR